MELTVEEVQDCRNFFTCTLSFAAAWAVPTVVQAADAASAMLQDMGWQIIKGMEPLTELITML